MQRVDSLRFALAAKDTQGRDQKKCHAKWLDSLHKQNQFIKRDSANGDSAGRAVVRQRRIGRPGGQVMPRNSTAFTINAGSWHHATRRAEPLWRSWCKSPIWKSIRRHRLAVEPRCRQCAIEGRAVAASHVDHINPHLGQGLLFFKYENTQSLCAHHHNMHKQHQ